MCSVTLHTNKHPLQTQSADNATFTQSALPSKVQHATLHHNHVCSITTIQLLVRWKSSHQQYQTNRRYPLLPNQLHTKYKFVLNHDQWACRILFTHAALSFHIFIISHATSLTQFAHFQNIQTKLNLRSSVPLQACYYILKLLTMVICRV